MGYCSREITITSEKISFLKSSSEKNKYPDKTAERALTKEEWQGLKTLVESNREKFNSLPDILRCTAGKLCVTDQGSEWIEISDSKSTKKIVFEESETPNEIIDLINKLRDLRTEMDSKIG